MSFFKNYSQNGAAQALVVLGAFTVAAEIVRTRKTGKRPYRDYGVGGMNEDEGSPVHHMMYGLPQGMGEHDDGGVHHEMGFDHGAGFDHEALDEDPFSGGELHAMRQRSAAQQARLQRATHQQASFHQEGLRQQAHADDHMREHDPEGSMARAPSKWNLYVATEVPRLMAEGKTAAQAMKEASRTFRYAPRSAGGLGEPKSVKVDRKLGRGR
jgi:hypothetical protein